MIQLIFTHYAIGVGVLGSVFGMTWWIDSWFYGKRTSSTINILFLRTSFFKIFTCNHLDSCFVGRMYNAFGGGDLLYGIEPMTYYLKNLILNLTFLLPLSVIQLILIYPISKILFKKQSLISSSSSTIQELNPMINDDEKKKEVGREKLRFFMFHICFSISPFLWFVVMMSRPHKVFVFFNTFDLFF